MNMIYVALILFSFIPVVSGYTGVFSILDEKYIDTIQELPPSINLKHEKNWQPSLEWASDHCTDDYSFNFIYGWVDIVGFDRSVKINNTFYLNESASTASIIQYETFVCVQTRVVHNKNGWDYKLETYQENDQFVAKLTATAILYSIDESGYKSYENETRVLYDSEPMPKQIERLSDIDIVIMESNNSFNPKTTISLNAPGNLSKVTYRYGAGSLSHSLNQGHVEQTAKGVYFLNLSSSDIWVSSGNTSLQQFNNMVILNSSRPDYSQLSIEISNPYETRTIPTENYLYERITYNSGSTFSDPLLMFVSMLATFFISSIIIIRRT